MNVPAEEPPSTSPRLLGYDVARALAILGMMLVHFALVMARESGSPAWLAGVLGYCDGRAAATFLVVAGAGISLRARKALASQDREALARVRSVLIRRGVFLLAVGFLNLAIWPGDILRVYGVSFLIAAWLFDVSDRALWGVAIGFVIGFLAWFFASEYEAQWD